METPKSKWHGLRAIVIGRQSNDKDGTSSTAAQLDHMKQQFQKVGLRYVDKILLDGVAASAPARISEILEKLIKRKKEKNDFDVIAWQVEDRASRGGGEHGMWLEHEAKRHGILVFFAGDDQPTGPYASVVRVSKYEAAKETSVGTGRRSTQGQSYAQEKGFFRTAGHTPIGCDRLYFGADDQAKFIIHNFQNGLQEQRDYVTGKIIGTYGTVGKKSRNRFVKQRNEYSLLVPGDREQRRVVRVIFYLRYKRGLRGLRIADFLNRNGITSPKGKEWSQRQVQVIYENESYTGVSYNNQTYSGRFFRRDKVFGFVPLDRDECELVMKKTFAPKFRPVKDWDRIDQPYMYDFLPRDVRDLAIISQAQIFKDRADPTRTPPKPNAHPASDFLLSGRLRAIQDDGYLFGTQSGPANKKTDYYRHRRSKRGHRKGSVFNNLIPAHPLHVAIMNELAEVLSDTPELKNRLTQYLINQRAEALNDQPDVAQLEGERDELNQKLTAALSLLTGAALEDAKGELKRLNDRRNEIEARLTNFRSNQKRDLRPVETVVDEALQILAESSEQLLDLSIQPLRDLVDRLILDPTVDMKTKVVAWKIALPTWALHAKPKKKRQKNAQNADSESDEAMCPDTNSRSLSGSWTQVAFATVICEYRHKRGSTTVPPCYQCRRKAA